MAAQKEDVSAKNDWAKRLLKLKNPQRDNEEDVFQPAVSQPYSDNLDEAEDDVATVKRLPAEMRCFDTARIFVKGGDGGNGCVAFRREKFVEWGGPSGGNGGRGGSVWAVVDDNLNSLTCFRTHIHWRATSGTNGQGSQLDGANAEDSFIKVPPGTIIRRRDAQEDEAPLAELVRPGDKALLIVGGRGGRGNYSFKTSRNKAPTIAEKGEEGGELWVDLELKVVADIGIIGIPNAGKSTLLSVVTAARPKIANYPFTTLVPNLGVCEMDYRTTVFADVPGLLEGAHEGLGLGHEFLRHVQRCRVLIHVIDGTSKDPMGDWRAINLELELFNPDLKDKPQIIAYNKIDIPDSGDYAEFVREELISEGVAPGDIFMISAATGQGVLDLVRQTRAVLDELGPLQQVYETNAVNVTKLPARDHLRLDEFDVEMERPQEDGPGFFYVQGKALEKFAQMTNWDYYESIKRFQKVLDAAGVNAALRAKGIREGDTVVIHESEFNWQNDQSDSAMYQAFIDDMKLRGKNIQGGARWPHASPKDPMEKLILSHQLYDMNIESMLEVHAPVLLVPDECRDMQLFVEVNMEVRSEGSQFKFGSSLKGAGTSKSEESAYHQRGDGKFEGGASFRREGNTIMLGPDALSGPNAEETLKALDAMSTVPDKRTTQAASSASKKPAPAPAWLSNSKGPMFDLD